MNKKIAYLTIDDSPSNDFTGKMEYLHQHQVPAIFFCIGELMEKYQEETIDAIKKGFVIANHSYTHPAFSKVPVEQCLDEISKTDRLIDELYEKADVERTAKWFRFPYGDKGDLKNGRVFSRWKRSDKNRKAIIQNHLIKLGYTQPAFPTVTYQYMSAAGLYDDIDWSWTFDIMEWALLEKKSTFKLNTLDRIFERLEQKRPRDCRGFLGFEKRWMQSDSAEVVLLHDHRETNEEFYKIIDKLVSMPLEFMPV